MVPEQVDGGETIELPKHTSRIVIYCLLGVVIFVLTLTLIFLLHDLNHVVNGPAEPVAVEPSDEKTDDSETESNDTPVETKPVISPIDFQPVIDSYIPSQSGRWSVLIYDLNLDQMVGTYNPGELYNTASLYKLFVVYEGYRRVENGTWDGQEIAGSTGKTILDCLDLSVRESHSPCAEVLWAKIGRSELDEIIENDYGITGADISSLRATPESILEIMKRFYHHPDFSNPEMINRMFDSFCNQPPTTYDWRRGLPSGFSRAFVFNKVGWDWNGASWNLFHNAAIVNFPEDDRSFAIVVMTNEASDQKIRDFGTLIEQAYYKED